MPRPNIGREELAEILGVLRDVVILVDRERRIQYVSRVEETADSHVTHGMCPECEADVAGENGEKSA